MACTLLDLFLFYLDSIPAHLFWWLTSSWSLSMGWVGCYFPDQVWRVHGLLCSLFTLPVALSCPLLRLRALGQYSYQFSRSLLALPPNCAKQPVNWSWELLGRRNDWSKVYFKVFSNILFLKLQWDDQQAISTYKPFPTYVLWRITLFNTKYWLVMILCVLCLPDILFGTGFKPILV